MASMEMEPEDLSYIALFGCGMLGMVIILRAIFTLPETQPDSARYLLSTLVQSEAAIIAIVVTLSLVAVQVAASSYSSRVIEIFKKMPSLWILIFIYISAMIQGLHVLKLIEASVGNTIGLENDILLSHYLGILAFLALIPYIWNTIGLLNINTILKNLSSKITKKNILAVKQPGYDESPFQSIIDIITGSLIRYDEGTVAIGLESMKSKIINILKSDDLSDAKEQLQFSENIFYYISELGYLAASRGDVAAIKRMGNAIEQMGLAAAEQNLDVVASKIAETLGAVGSRSTENKLDFSTYAIVDSLINIEIKAVERKLGVTAIQVALELNSIGTILQERGQEGLPLFNFIGINIINKILFNAQMCAEQKRLFDVELEKAVSQRDSIALINISMAYRIFDYIREADSIKEMAFRLQNADKWYNQGWNHSQQGEYDEAIKAFDKAIELNPDLAEAWNNKGASLNKLNKSEEAIRAIERAIKIDPQNSGAWNNKGNALKTLGNHDEAIKAYNRAIEINPQNAMAWFNKGTILNEQGENDEAINAFDQAIGIEPRYSKAFINRGNAFYELGRIYEAIDSFDRAINIDPQLPEAWDGKGRSLRSQGKYNEAIKAFDKAIELKSDYAEVWCNKGLTLEESGKHEDAIQAYNMVIEIDPSIWQAWVGKGLALKSLNRTAESDAAFAEAKMLGYKS